MSPLTPAWIASILMILVTGPMFVQTPVDIVKVRFCSGAGPSGPPQPGQEVTSEVSASKLKDGRLYLFFTIMGGKEAIEHLERHGHLDVSVEWEISSRIQSPIFIGLSQDDWDSKGTALKYEYEERGIFTYRTYCWTKQISPGKVAAFVRAENGNMLTLVGAAGAFFKPTITITP